MPALILSCSTHQKQDASEQPQETTDKMVGNDVDKNGCKGSAGYQWSQLKNNCIRYFEEGVKLSSVDKNSSTGAFLVIVGDKMEVSAAEFPEPIILQKQNDTTWKNGVWEVELKNNMYGLKKEGKILYRN